MTRPPLILVVEDNPRNLKLVRDVLDHVGYRTLVAEYGEQGVELAGAHRPDLTLMDVQLPGIDGVEALSRLRADPATARLRVAALTASVMKEDRDRLLAAGFDGYLEKPLDVRAFPAQVAALLEGRKESAP
jgi:two-component system cell cycle response regulator DivK